MQITADGVKMKPFFFLCLPVARRTARHSHYDCGRFQMLAIMARTLWQQTKQEQLIPLCLNPHGGNSGHQRINCYLHSWRPITFLSHPSPICLSECIRTRAACRSPSSSSGYWGAVRSSGRPGNCGRGHEIPWTWAMASGYGGVV